MKTIDEYLAEYGLNQSDFTDDELAQAHEELAIINNGGFILDGICEIKKIKSYYE